jgi:methionine-rich copper-binding protein CopC
VTNAVVTINPTSDLTVGQSYYVHIAPTAIHDVSGNNYAGITANTTWNFNTNDLTAPTILPPFTPTDDATGVAVATNLVINFSEPVAFGIGNIMISFADGTTYHGIDVSATTEATISGSTVTIDLTADLPIDQSYYVTIVPSAIHDLAGNNFAGIMNGITWNFNTNTNTPPALAATPFVPADNATNVAIANPLSVTFTENIQLAATGTVKLFLSNGTLVESFGQASAGLSVVNDQLTITPTAALNESTAYYVTIDAGFITDLIANAYAGFTDNATWNFTTGDFTAPTLITSSLSPADNATNVPLSTTLSMTFSEPVAFGTGIIHLNDLSGNGSTQQFDVSTGTGLSISGSTITVTPAALHLLTNYAVIIDATAVQDLSGNAFAGIANPTTWNFTSDDAQGLDELALIGVTWNGTTLTIAPTTTVTANLYDASGKLIKAHLGQTTNCSDLTTGVYLLGLLSETTYQTVRLYVR